MRHLTLAALVVVGCSSSSTGPNSHAVLVGAQQTGLQTIAANTVEVTYSVYPVNPPSNSTVTINIKSSDGQLSVAGSPGGTGMDATWTLSGGVGATHTLYAHPRHIPMTRES